MQAHRSGKKWDHECKGLLRDSTAPCSTGVETGQQARAPFCYSGQAWCFKKKYFVHEKLCPGQLFVTLQLYVLVTLIV